MKAKASSHSPDSVAVIYVAVAAQVFSRLLAQKTGGALRWGRVRDELPGGNEITHVKVLLSRPHNGCVGQSRRGKKTKQQQWPTSLWLGEKLTAGRGSSVAAALLN